MSKTKERTSPRIEYIDARQRSEKKIVFASRDVKFKGKQYRIGDEMAMNGIEAPSAVANGFAAEKAPSKTEVEKYRTANPIKAKA